MLDTHIPGEVLHNIFARLPGKSLARFRCVSNYWNRLISDPYLENLLSRQMILVQFEHLYTIENNVSVNDMAQSMVKIPSGFGNINFKFVTVVGTFNGIFLLVLEDTSLCTCTILYNPFTQEYNKVPDPPFRPRVRPPLRWYDCHFNIGFGKTPDDFKIVRFFDVKESLSVPERYSCYVFSVKNSLWSKPIHFTQNFRFCNDVGMFLNGFLYWIIISYNPLVCWVILALDIKKMALMTINIPNQCEFTKSTHSSQYYQWNYYPAILGELHGCLCIIQSNNGGMFDLWVMKEQGVGNSWSIARSFRLRIEGVFSPIRVLDNGRILFTDEHSKVVIYDTSNDSEKTFSFPDFPSSTVYGIEYVQTLVSPSNMCSL